ncbi:MAG: ADP-ribosylglycohydrolase family protein [Pseudomonadales bacterium]|nr:ADP-ribosylglycohydrolase family protein [Pseudomonadales bacterium]
MAECEVPGIAERAVGALMGALIGDALALGPHWYYDLDELRRDYGPWVSTYTDPKAHRYHAGLKAGSLSQAGHILVLMLRSLAELDAYQEADFCKRMDEDLFPLLDGTPMHGPGGYTSQSIRDAWKKRVQQGLPWGQTGGHADTTEAIERTLAIAVRYARQPDMLASFVSSNAMLTQIDDTVVAMTVAFAAVLAQLVQGYALDEQLSGRLMSLVKSGELPFHAVTSDNLSPPAPGEEPSRAGRFASPDALLTPSCVAVAVNDPDICIEPAWKVSLVYGMPCAIYHQLPAAYYLGARFKTDFESAVLHAVNGGGQNQARAMLTGALVGAQVGWRGIPERFREGLHDSQHLLKLAEQIAVSV